MPKPTPFRVAVLALFMSFASAFTPSVSASSPPAAPIENVVGEFYGWENERLPERLAPILERTSGIHGRISNGEQIQVDVGDGSEGVARTYMQLWAQAMRAWLSHARPGDVVPFASELGPPAYAIRDPKGQEISDRWEQSLVMKRLAEEAWETARSG